jgi:hypothetical protein
LQSIGWAGQFQFRPHAHKITAFDRPWTDSLATHKKFEELHMAAAPVGEPIPIHITPTPKTDDRPPEEEEVKQGVQKMNSCKAAGATGTAVQHVKEWMAGAEDDEHPTCIKEWRMVLDLVECCFTNDAEDAPSRTFEIGALALMPKDVTSYCGIVLLETICKLASAIETCGLHVALSSMMQSTGTKQRGEWEQ